MSAAGAMKVVPSYIITSYLAGDYFQALRNITAPAALMVRHGCVSHLVKSEAAGSLIAPWWLAAVQVINPALSM